MSPKSTTNVGTAALGMITAIGGDLVDDIAETIIESVMDSR
jgi:hypothetical protein